MLWGAAFKFYSGLEVNRAPRWMVEHHLEFVHRLWKEPRKQWTRCRRIITSLPRLYFEERRRARDKHEHYYERNHESRVAFFFGQLSHYPRTDLVPGIIQG